jgi:dienelactone hydrolase
VVNIGYTQGYWPTGAPDPTPMLRDVVAFYDQIRSAFGGPVCAYGQSAGGHLAAMLAVERPTLTCAVLDAAPTDLPSMLPKSNAKNFVEGTFGTDPSTLARWSPARDWRPTIHTPVYATFAANDPTVPPQQGAIFKAADPEANVDTVPGGTFYWLHSLVDYNSLFSRDLTGLVAWLKGEMPGASTAPAAAVTDAGSACALPPPSGQRYKLMLAGDAWQQQSTWTVGQPALIAATRGCSGSSYWQDDGLSLWAWTSGSSPLAQGQGASLTLAPGHTISGLSVSFRGFLARPQDWNLGLYATPSQSGPVSTPVATCERGSCSGLGLFRASSGSLVTTSGSRDDPDLSAKPPSATFALPAGTVRVAWTLQCVAPGGCPVQSMAQPRPRDPLGQQAIFSIYSAVVR